MIEAPTPPWNEPRQEFRKGTLVKLLDGLDPEVTAELPPQIVPGTTYRVLHFGRRDDEGGNVVWLGPNDMSEQEVAEFRPELATTEREERYKDVTPIAAIYFQKALD